jgi:hypothetical protein
MNSTNPGVVIPGQAEDRVYGAGNGLLTIARETMPLAWLGLHGYGERTGSTSPKIAINGYHIGKFLLRISREEKS